MNRLLHSAKFWTAVLDVVVSFAAFFLTKYAAPDLAEDALFVIGGLQPVWLMVIGSIAYEDAAEKKAAVYMQKPAE